MYTERYEWVKEYHQQLISTSNEAQKVKSLRDGRPNWKDQAYLHLGDLLISAGERLRNESAYAQLCEECA
jgi:hypothetical protein